MSKLSPEKAKQYDEEIRQMCERLIERRKNQWKWILLACVLCPMFLPIGVGLIAAGAATAKR